MPSRLARSLSRRCTSSGTWRIWIIRVFMRNSISACVAHAPAGSGACPQVLPANSGFREPDPEPLDGELQDDLPRGGEVGDAGGGEALQVGQAVGVGVGAGAAGGGGGGGGGAGLGPGVAQE